MSRGNRIGFGLTPATHQFNPGTLNLMGYPNPSSTTGNAGVLQPLLPGAFALAGQSTSFTGPGGTSQFFPHFGLQAINGSQYPIAANGHSASYYDNLMGQYPWIMLGHPFRGVTRNRSDVVNSLKGQPLTGRNAVRPIVGQYCNFNECPPASGGSIPPFFPEWCTQLTAANWWLYNVGTSGTKAQSAFDATWGLCDMAHTASTNKSQYKGAGATLWPYEWAAAYAYDLFIAGGLDATMNAANMDFLYCDNTNIRALARNSADWQRIGSSQNGSTDPTTIALTTLGKQDWSSKLRALQPSLLVSANTEYSYDTVSLGLNGSNISGIFDFPMNQYIWGSPLSSNSAYRVGGFALAMQYYKALQSTARNGASTPTAAFRSLAADEVPLRLALCMCLMDNGYLILSFGDGITQDTFQPNVDSNYPVCDEFWGGALNVGGYLGNRLGPVQNAAWSNGVWRADFDNGIALANSGTSASSAVALGNTFYRLRTINGQSVNTAAAVSSLSVPGSDALILMRAPT